MSYYRYENYDYPAYVNLGAAGDCEINVHVCLEIDYQDIINEMGDEVWDYVDAGQHILDNHKDYMENMVEEACTDGLEDFVNCLVERYKGITFNASQDFHGRLGNAVVWSVLPTNINAACDGFLYGQLCWYDNVNDRLWVFPYDVSPTTLHTAYITLETGAVTYVGSAVLSAGPNSYSTQGYGSVHRDAVSSGNFTIQTHTQTYVISDSDGSEVSYTSGVTNGKVGYVTSDGSASLYIVALGDSDANRGFIEARKDGKAVRIPTPIGLLGWMGSNSRNLHFIPWGDKVKVVSVTTSNYLKATFDRAEFDQWVQDLLKYGGVE